MSQRALSLSENTYNYCCVALFCLQNTQKYPTKRQFWKVAANRVLNTLFFADHMMTIVL